jgi:acetyltransferase-like isoleucine patch superfamily enzyme
MPNSVRPDRVPFEDPFDFFSRVMVKLYSIWVSGIYPFASRGRNLSIHHSCLLPRSIAPRIQLGSSVFIGKSTWFNIVHEATGQLNIVIEDNCRISPRSVISARNLIHLECDVILAPAALLMDHNHAFEDPSKAISHQGTTEGGTIRIGRGAYIGHGAAVVCGRGDLELGERCVVEANSVVTRSMPAYSVVSGNPAKVVRQYDPVNQAWVGIRQPSTETKSTQTSHGEKNSWAAQATDPLKIHSS